MNYNYNKSKNPAFTLAEILITLSVIGILASITMPSLIQNTQEKELRTAFKKAYSDFAQVTKKVIQDNGGTMVGICLNGDHDCLKNKYIAHLNIIKNCKNGESLGICWHDNDGSSKYLRGQPYTTWGNLAGFILNNGTLVRVWMVDPACKNQTYSPRGECANILLDVNGFKKPNTLGKDIFYLHVYEDCIAPWGTSDDDSNSTSRSASCSKTSSGRGCAALVLQDIDY